MQRRCLQRQFLLRPDDDVNNLFWYCLIRALDGTGVELIGGLMMSNHYHLVVRDVRGILPDVLRDFHSVLARSLNCLRGRRENVWSAHEQTSFVELVSPDDVVAKTVYTYANPAKANLVESVKDWPGANSWSTMFAKRRVISAKRPTFFFSRDQPERVQVELQLPTLNNDDGAAFVARVKRGVREAEDDALSIRRQRDAVVRDVMGRHRVLKQRWDARPATIEPRGKLSPRVACISKWHRIEALARNRAWLTAYTEARDAWRRGQSVTFPPGTWQVVRFGPARALEPPVIG